MMRLGDYEKNYAPWLALKRLRFRHTKVDSIPTDSKGDKKTETSGAPYFTMADARSNV